MCSGPGEGNGTSQLVPCCVPLSKYSALQILPQPSPITFKIPGFKPPVVARTQEIQPLSFSKPAAMCIPMYSSLLPFAGATTPSHLLQIGSLSLLNYVSVLLTFSKVASSLSLVEAFVLSVVR